MARIGKRFDLVAHARPRVHEYSGAPRSWDCALSEYLVAFPMCNPLWKQGYGGTTSHDHKGEVMSQGTAQRRLLVGGLVIIGLVTAGCGSDESDAGRGMKNDVTGSVTEWAVEVNAEGAMAGDVTFTITNRGTIDHEFLVVKTDIPDGEIPLVDNRFEEDAEGLEVVDEIPEFPKGETNALTVNLTPGNYQLLCNIEGHYQAGMHTSFVVQ